MTAPCSRCLRTDCGGLCPDIVFAPADGFTIAMFTPRHPLDEHISPTPRPGQWPTGTQPGTSKPIGSRVAVTYQHIHTRKGEPPTTETRHAFGKVTSILPDGALWVVTDREGGLRIEATNVEVIQ